jgi:hypothetical protein
MRNRACSPDAASVLDRTITRAMAKNRPRPPEQVFTPKAVVSPEMFTRRNEIDLQGNPGLQDTLREALRELGGQVLLYGDTGVGKSSLLRYAANDEAMSVVSIECFSGREYESLIEDGIRQLVEVREVKRTRGSVTGGEAEAGGTIASLVSLKGKTRARDHGAESSKWSRRHPSMCC